MHLDQMERKSVELPLLIHTSLNTGVDFYKSRQVVAEVFCSLTLVGRLAAVYSDC
jgi:hypothetical protein